MQTLLLKYTVPLQNLINNRLATRPGAIGRFFKGLEMGKREYSAHTFHRAFRVVNFFWMHMFLCNLSPGPIRAIQHVWTSPLP